MKLKSFVDKKGITLLINADLIITVEPDKPYHGKAITKISFGGTCGNGVLYVRVQGTLTDVEINLQMN